jgi:flagellar biosynthesis protein FlhB
VKTTLKVAALAVVGYVIMSHLVHAVLGGATLPLQTTLLATVSTVTQMMRSIGILALVIAGGDYYFQRRSHNQDLRMTKQEVRDERRESDGNPEVRRALRTKARRLSRMHVMAAVARADVVVVNPTHFAVAIAYDREKDRAPRVVAKGADYTAMAIREHASRCGVVLVESPILARALHGSCEVDDVVPPTLYAAVARLLAFVYSLTPAARVYGGAHRMAG